METAEKPSFPVCRKEFVVKCHLVAVSVWGPLKAKAESRIWRQVAYPELFPEEEAGD